MSLAEAPRGSAFEWFVAWRHLRDPERRSHRVLIAGASLVVLSAAAFVAATIMGGRGGDGFIRMRAAMIADNVRIVAFVVGILGLLIAYFGGLRSAAFSVFTALSITGVTVGTFAPIVALSVMSGFETDLKTKIRGAKADVVISLAEDAPFLDWADVRKRIASVPRLVASTPYLEGEVMIRTAQAASGIIVRGIDPATAPAVLNVTRNLRDGKLEDLVHPERIGELPRLRTLPFDDLDREEEARKHDKEPAAPREVLPAIILGEELYAHTLRVFIGSEVEVACPMCRIGPTGPMPGLGRFRVGGHFYSGMYEYDSKLAYVSLAEAQRFLRTPGEVTGIDIRTATPDDALEVARAVQALLGPRYEVRSWEDLNRSLFRALRVEKIGMFVALAFIGLVASFSIISTLIMSVTQKAREVAILKSMGASNGAVGRIFFAEGLYIGLIGLVVGVVGGVASCLLIVRFGLPLPTDIYYINQLPVVMKAGEILSIGFLALVMCCLATVYPAMVGASMRPVEGLKYE
jgi:lipoprotein-releasing system permease protein